MQSSCLFNLVGKIKSRRDPNGHRRLELCINPGKSVALSEGEVHTEVEASV